MVDPKRTLRVTREALDRVEAEAVLAYARDEEACGYLRGPATDDALADEAVVLVNLANRYHALDPEAYPRTGRTYFLIDPMKFDKAVRAGSADGRPVRVLFHSHLDVGAYFSPTDAEVASMGGTGPAYDLYYLVTSVRAGKVDDHKLFAWKPDTSSFVEAPLEVVAR